MNTKEFRSQTGKPVRISLVSGHTIIIPADEWADVPEIFWSEAFSKGCLSKDTLNAVMAEQVAKEQPKIHKMMSNLAERRDAIERVLAGWFEAGEMELHLTAKGTPNTSHVDKALGYRVNKADIDAAFYRIKEQQQAAERYKQ